MAMLERTRERQRKSGRTDIVEQVTDILDSDARQRAEIRRLRADVKRKNVALVLGIGQAPYGPTLRKMQDALNPTKRGKS